MYRGRLAEKNKGEIAMYFVQRLKPEFAADADGIVPNERLLSERNAMNLTAKREAA